VQYGADNNAWRCQWLRLAMHGDARGAIAKTGQNVSMRYFARANADLSKQSRNMYRYTVCIVAAQSALDGHTVPSRPKLATTRMTDHANMHSSTLTPSHPHSHTHTHAARMHTEA
jgi:hypothetical protein